MVKTPNDGTLSFLLARKTNDGTKEFLSDLVFQGETCASKVPYAQANVSFNWIGLPTYLSQLDTPMLNAWLIYYAAERPCLRQSLQHLSSLSEAYLNTNLKKTPFNFTFDDFKKNVNGIGWAGFTK
ncbi:MAG: hypothetical protein HC773_29050 [Scytonema sp. CRU_2_7]|nr:hypothetical protein [Scytonema sp. CRU_2_7]